MSGRTKAAGLLLLALAAGCAGEEPAPAGAPADAASPIEIVVERPVAPDGVGGLAGSAAAASGGSSAGELDATPVPDGFVALVPRLAVRDLGASVAFYRALLGFEPVGPAAGGPAAGDGAITGGRALLARGPVRLALEETPAELGEAPSPATAGEEPAIALVLSIADAATLFDRLADRAPLVTGLRDTAWGTREFALADPDGHVVVLSQPF